MQSLCWRHHVQASGWIHNNGKTAGLKVILPSDGHHKNREFKGNNFPCTNSPTSPLHLKTELHVIAAQSTEINIKPGEIPINWCKDYFCLNFLRVSKK